MKNYRILKKLSKELNVSIDELVPRIKKLKEEVERGKRSS